jgi:hypothetical protein
VLGYGFDAGFSGHEHVHLPGEEGQAVELVQFGIDHLKDLTEKGEKERLEKWWLQIIIGVFSVFDGFDFHYLFIVMDLVDDPPITRSGRTLASGRLERLGDAGIIGI